MYMESDSESDKGFLISEETSLKCIRNPFFFPTFFYFHENMTQIQHMMMVPIVHADYGYILT